MLLFSTLHRRMQFISYVKYPAVITRQSSANLQGSLHFYQNKQLELYASRKAKPLTLRQLVFYGKSMNEDRLIKSANYVRTELPVRLSHRIRDMQALPYAVVTREGVAAMYRLYWSAFEKFRRYPQINSLEDNAAFCTFLKEMLDEHLPVIPNLYLGLSLASHHLLPEQLDSFMRRMLVSRISRRVLAEHHLALSASFRESRSSKAPPANNQAQGNVGIIYTDLSVKSSIEHCVTLIRSCPHHVLDLDSRCMEDGNDLTEGWPEVIIDGDRDTRFSYIKDHLDYIVFELLKNALRFTIKHNKELHKPPGSIKATIVASPDDVSIRITDEGGGLSANPYVQAPSDLFSFSHLRNAGRLEDVRLIALRDAISNSRGIKGTVGEQVAKLPVDVSSELRERVGSTENLPHIGIGLPMSNVFAGYFGGSLQLVPMDGWGTDVYVRLPKLGTNLEGIEV
ncbi:branched-chain alpha-ketoacid dehydrogenase [Hysterangium stoloniferum]|nr:branched-chain alpha-ketoacid dehydrogenase [Hysterangium stoloniferum]